MKRPTEYLLDGDDFESLKKFVENRGYGVYGYVGKSFGSIHNGKACTSESCERFSKFTWDGDSLALSDNITLNVRDTKLIDIIESYLVERIESE